MKTQFFFNVFLFILFTIKGIKCTGCGYPGAPAHSTVRFTDNSDDVLDEEDSLIKDTVFPTSTVATYTCERGFELLGPARRQCQADGTWTPEGVPFCVLNVAGGKAPMQSSSAEGGIPQKAVDGSSGQVYNPQTCTLTRSEAKPWWYVNLLEPYMVQLVRLDFGKACCDGTSGTIVVRVGNNRPDLGTNPICNKFSGPLEEGQPLFLPCNPPMPGAFVSVHLEASSHTPTPVQLSLCEAFVYTDQALPIERCPQFRDQPPGSTATYNGKCYIFYNRQPMQFREALAFCRARGGTLVDESNPALQGFISWELWRRHRSDTSSQYWMGAVRDSKDKSIWRWTGSGDEVAVSFWSLPQGTQEDCARYDGSRGWLWSDTPCTARLNYICQHQPRACGRPEQPPNSTMIITNQSDDSPSTSSLSSSGNNYQVGATVAYSCNAGSLLIGPSTRTCLDTGFYNEFPPVCKSIECGFPASIKHGEYTLINNTVTYLSQVLYSCEDGYEMTGRARLTCDIDERWNGPPPRCEPIRCDPPPLVTHSSVQLDEMNTDNNNLDKSTNRSLIVGSIVTYTCDKGYKVSGTRQILCLPTGLYDHPAPVCLLEEIRTTVRSTTRPPVTRGKPFYPARTRTTTESSSTDANNVAEDKISIAELPATVREAAVRKPPISLRKPAPTSSSSSSSSPALNNNNDDDHPQDNEISASGVDNARAKIASGVSEPTGPYRVDTTTYQAKLSLGGMIALGVVGSIIIVSVVATTVVVLMKRTRGSKHYRHRASPDCNTVASFDSSSSESRGGLNRYYRQAWENLHEATGQKANPPLRRKDTLDDPNYRDNYRGNENNNTGGDDPSAFAGNKHSNDKKRHHHHHHHHHGSTTNSEWRQSQTHHRY
ncbi:uncharacterized protein LOC130672805 isoform X1 [Microplitis mediator]|uniref:uncharacterized protein LOC130672805 isoform X1 n=2 Tax=Microplitis mediator TaxID=375433 RepID=UPI0025537557|nr:uncharacterized protein LOC130672805 isoform X1 [Microplitis mediator]